MKNSKRVKAGKKGKAKGARFERQIASQLREWWAQYEPDVEFARTPASGGSQLKVGWDLAGDITTTSEIFPFHVECKNQENWTMDQVAEMAGPVLEQWWPQTIRDCPSHRVPLLVFTRSYRPIWCMTSLAATLLTDLHETQGPLSATIYSPNNQSANTPHQIIFQFARLLKTKPQYWKQLLKPQKH